MFSGHFDVVKHAARGLTDDDFKQAIRAGKLHELLKELPVLQRAQGSNRIFDNMAGYLLDRLFSLGACAAHYDATDGNPASTLWGINLLTNDAETTSYTEDETYRYSYGRSLHNRATAANSSSGGKRFEEDQIYGWTIGVDLDNEGRESIYFRNNWLYLPTEGASSDIRSIGIYFCSDGDRQASDIDYYQGDGRIGRIRLKDANGQKTIITKDSNEVLFLEYTFQLVSA